MMMRLKSFLAAVACCVIGDLSHAEQLGGTHLLDVRLGSPKAHLPKHLQIGGYELSDGRYQDFQDWYSVRRPAVSFLFMTEINPDLAVVWGASTQERGEKYSIQPALQLGMLLQREITSGTFLSFGASVILAGDFLERSCTADYGPIAGIQQVNCRLAAGLLPPQDTLDYLLEEPGWYESRLTLRLEKRF
jgi:hypothetical protein